MCVCQFYFVGLGEVRTVELKVVGVYIWWETEEVLCFLWSLVCSCLRLFTMSRDKQKEGALQMSRCLCIDVDIDVPPLFGFCVCVCVCVRGRGGGGGVKRIWMQYFI